MRRPLKPFITEYKGSSRRPHPHAPDPMVTEHQTVVERAVTGGARERPVRALDFSARSEPEDSYEAAMRAADALFSPRPNNEPANPPSSDAGTTAELAKIFAPKAEPAQDVKGSDVGATARGGRILPALNEEPLPQLIALEETHAPKRRGRKPGSKNKPRPAHGADESNVQSAPPLLAALDRQDEAPVLRAPRRVAAPLRAEAPRAPRRPLERCEPLIEASVPLPARRLRFSWLDKTLKPGEFWKRRLPKVCW